MPAAIGPIVAGAITGAGLVAGGMAIPYAIGIGVAVAGLQAVSSFLGPKTRTPSATYDSDFVQTTSSPSQPVAVVFGSCMVGGNMVRATIPGKSSREIVLALADGECHAIHRVRINDVDFDTLRSTPIQVFLSGTATQNAPDSATFPLLHADGKIYPMRHTASLWLRLQHENLTGPGQRYTCTLEGRLCWDTAFTTRSFSRNPARIAITYLRDIRGIPPEEIDSAAFATLEVHCDVYGTDTDTWSEDLTGAGSITAKSQQWSDSNRNFYAATNALISNGSEETSVWASDKNDLPQWLKYDFGAEASVRVGQFSLEAWRNFFPTDFYLEASNDDAEWTPLDIKEENDPAYASSWSGTWSDYESKTFLVDPNYVGRYRYYRLAFTASNESDGQIDVMRLKMFALLGSIAPRHRFDYVIDVMRPASDIEKEIGRSFHGRLIRSNGQWKPVWLKNQGSNDFTFNTARAEIEAGEDEVPNLVRIHYRNRARDFMKDTVEIRNDFDIGRRGEVVNEESCDFITDREIALKRAQFLFDRARLCPGWCSIKAGLTHSNLELFDVGTVEHAVLGNTPQRFYIEQIRRDELNRPSQIKLREYNVAIFHDRLAYDQERYTETSEQQASMQIAHAALAAGTSTQTRFAWTTYEFIGDGTTNPITVPAYVAGQIRLVVEGSEWAPSWFNEMEDSNGNYTIIQPLADELPLDAPCWIHYVPASL